MCGVMIRFFQVAAVEVRYYTPILSGLRRVIQCGVSGEGGERQCLARGPECRIPIVNDGYKEGSNYKKTFVSKRGYEYFGSTGDVGGPCVGEDGKRPLMCLPKAGNGFCEKDLCKSELQACMDLCDSIPSCRGFSQHYGGCYVHIGPKDKEAKIADGTFSRCSGNAASWPPVCTNRNNEYCGNTEPTNNCLIKKWTAFALRSHLASKQTSHMLSRRPAQREIITSAVPAMSAGHALDRMASDP